MDTVAAGATDEVRGGSGPVVARQGLARVTPSAGQGEVVMNRVGSAVGMAALCCFVVNAGTGGTKFAGQVVLRGRTPQLPDQSLRSRGYMGGVSGAGASRAVETAYDNTVNSTAAGTSFDVGSEYGDELRMTGAGLMTDYSFSLVNFAEEDLYTVDIELRFHDVYMGLVGTYDLGTVSFPWPRGLRAGGWGVTLDIDTSTAGIYLPLTAVCTQVNTNPTGSGTITDGLGPMLYDPPAIGASGNYFYADGGWWWFAGHPVASFYNKVGIQDPAPPLPPPPLYDNTTGGASYGFADVEGSWIGDDVTFEDYGDPPNPTWALNGGMLDKLAWTFWNYGAGHSHPAGIISADWTVEFFERSDPSVIAGQPHTWHLDYSDSPLPAGYYSRWHAWNLKIDAVIPLKPGSYGLRCSASNVVWEADGTPGEIGQILYSPESAGDSDSGAFWDDSAPKWGTDAGWYSFVDGTVADFYYRIDVLRWFVGDMNCDGYVNNFDIDPFVIAVASGQSYYECAFPGCEFMNADINQDGAVNNFDIDPFVGVLCGGS